MTAVKGSLNLTSDPRSSSSGHNNNDHNVPSHMMMIPGPSSPGHQLHQQQQQSYPHSHNHPHHHRHPHQSSHVPVFHGHRPLPPHGMVRPPPRLPLISHPHPFFDVNFLMPHQLMPMPLPPPPYSTLPSRHHRRRLIDSVISLNQSFQQQQQQASPPSSQPQTSSTPTTTTMTTSGAGAAAGNSLSAHHQPHASACLPQSDRRSPAHQTSPSSSPPAAAANTCTNNAPTAAALPSYHNLFSSSTSSSMRQRRRRMMRQQRLDPDSSHLSENKKYLVFVSLFVVGIVLTFIGVVTLSLFTISFGFTFILFSLLLYKLLPASKYAPRSMIDRGRASMTLSPRSHHPYMMSPASGDPNALSFVLPPPPPSYQEALNSAQLIQSLDPASLQQQHLASVTPQTANCSSYNASQSRDHRSHRSQNRSCFAVDEVTVTSNSLPAAEPTIVTIESPSHVHALHPADRHCDQQVHPHHAPHQEASNVTISTVDGSVNNNRLHFVTIIEATI